MYKIAISGKANTGKNTLSKILKQEIHWKNIVAHRALYDEDMNFSWKSIAFADPIKEIVLLMFPKANKDNLYGPSHLRAEIIPDAFKNGKPLTYRQALIDLGTEVGRSYNNKIWLENFDKRIDEMISKTKIDLIIVTDVRFRNEFDHLKEKGYCLIRLYRQTNQEPINHISESNQSDIRDSEFDYVIHNDKPLDDLKAKVIDEIIPNLKSA